MATVDTLSIDIKTSSTDARKSLEDLLKTLKKFQKLDNGTLNSISRSFRSINSSIGTISAVNIRKIERLADALERLKAVRNVNTRVTNTVVEASQAVEQVRPSITNVTNPATTTSGGSATGNVTQVGEEAEQAAKKVDHLANAMNVAKSVGKGFSVAFSILGKAISSILKPITRFIKSLVRVAFYRFIRGIIKSITEGFKEGIQNLALYSKALEGLDTHNTNEVMSRYSSSFLYFKNAIATAVIPILRALIPIVEEAIKRIVDFINVLAQVGSAFFGGTFTKAKYYWVDYAESIDKATGSAKALHHQLAGFDELNNLTDSNSGGGGGSNLLNPADMFEESEIDSKIKGFVDKIKGAFEKIRATIKPYVDKFKEIWNEIVEKVSPHLKKIWENIKKIWDKLKPIFEAFGSGYIQGFKDNFDIESLPDDLEKIAETIEFLSDVITKLIEKMDIEKVKNFAEKFGYLNGKVAAILNPINQLSTYIEWFAMACKIGEAWGRKLAEAIVDNLDKIIKFKIKLDEIKDKLETFTQKIVGAASGTSNLKDKIVSFIVTATSSFSTNNVFQKAKDIADKVKEAVQFVIDKISTFKVSVNGSTNAKIFSSANTVADVLKSTIETIIKLISTLNGMSATIKINVEGAVASGLSGIGGQILNKIEEVVGNTLDSVPTPTYSTKTGTSGHTPTTSTSKPSGYQYGNPNQQVKSLAELKKRASGGYVPNGDLFLANEKGAEFIGAIGGNTAVANNNQITEAIAQATYTAMTQALSENGGTVNIVVEGDGDRMFKVFQKKQREATRTTGFAY